MKFTSSAFWSSLGAILAGAYLVLILAVLVILQVAPGETIGGIAVLLTHPSYLVLDFVGVQGHSDLDELVNLGGCALLNTFIVYLAGFSIEKLIERAK